VRWELSGRASARCLPLANRHYTRQSPDSGQFVPPGACLVLYCPGAYWVTSWPRAEYVKHAWAGAWVCSAFRNERPDLYLSSGLIIEAVAATRWRWPDTPALGVVTFVDARKIRRKRDPGRCFRKAGFRPCGNTKGGLLALQLLPADMPDPAPPLWVQPPLW
jgi:hypothetical protein